MLATSPSGSSFPHYRGYGGEAPHIDTALGRPAAFSGAARAFRSGEVTPPLKTRLAAVVLPCTTESGAAGAALQRGGGGAAYGLVHSQTSENRKPERHRGIHLDQAAMRLSRLKRSTITAARLHQEAVQQGGFRGRWAFLTATYAAADAWKPRHLPELLDNVRKWLGRKGHRMAYVWVAEIQPGRYRRTGEAVLHYHVMIWLPKGLSLPKPDKQGWWRHGMTKVEWALNPVGYMAKYSSKGDGPGKFPKGARIHGCGGLQGEQRQEASYWRRPQWLRQVTGIQDQVRRRVGGGWLDIETGELFESPWVVFFEGGGVYIRERVATGDTLTPSPTLSEVLPL